MLSANNCVQNGLLICNVVCSAANILLMHKWNHAFILVNALAWKSRSLRWPFIERFVIEHWNSYLTRRATSSNICWFFLSKNKSSRWLTCCLCFCLPLFRTDFTEGHCPLYLQLFKRIKNRDQIQVRRRHFQLLQIDLNCKRSVITTIMITSWLLWSQINHVGR